MPSTFLALHYHIVFSTQGRKPLIDASWRERLHEYLGGTVSGLGGFTQGVGGVADHVHLLVGLKATHCLSDVMLEFAWQEGYGAFTVSPTARPKVRKYIANQARHHRVMSFREELVEFLNKAGVKYEDRYLD